MDVHTFDVFNWRPITPIEYLSRLREIYQGSAEPEDVTTKMETFEEIHERMVTYAEIKKNGRPESSVYGPYLMILIQDDGRRLLCFQRTDAYLA